MSSETVEGSQRRFSSTTSPVIPRLTLQDRLEWLLTNPATTDIHLVIGTEETSKERIGANKAILAAASEVFDKMFYGDFGSPPEVDVPDATPEAFKIFLKYIYTDKANLNSSNAYEVHYLAEKYMVEGLRHEAMEVIKKSITSTNVLDFLRDTALVKEIMSHCWDIIDSEAKDVLQSEQFLNVPHSLLLAIISRDRLDVKEITVYERTIEWAKEEAKRSGHDITPQSVRIVLGPAFYEIRYNRMSITQFGKGPATDEYLSKDEKLSFFMYFTSGTAPASFNVKQRTEVWPILRRSAELHIRSNY